MSNDEVLTKSIDAVIAVTGCSEEDAETFLDSERGCYMDVGSRSVWVSGQFISQILKVALDENY